jgi:hypothetical protein
VDSDAATLFLDRTHQPAALSFPVVSGGTVCRHTRTHSTSNYNGAPDTHLATAHPTRIARHHWHLRFFGRRVARMLGHGPRSASRRCTRRRLYAALGTRIDGCRRRSAAGRPRLGDSVWPRARRFTVGACICRHAGRRSVGIAHRASRFFPLHSDCSISVHCGPYIFNASLFSTVSRASQVSMIAFNVQLDAPAATGVAYALANLLVASAATRVDVVAATSTRSMPQRADAWHAAPMRYTLEQHTGMHIVFWNGVPRRGQRTICASSNPFVVPHCPY